MVLGPIVFLVLLSFASPVSKAATRHSDSQFSNQGGNILTVERSRVKQKALNCSFIISTVNLCIIMMDGVN